MKCPICNGKGTQFIADYDGTYDIVCDKCKGKGELDENGKPILTNEEYLKSCNTEQLAEAIYYLTWFHTELDERLDKNVKNGCYNDDENIKIVMEWLKQPHTPKE